jgi:hypothetical protein
MTSPELAQVLEHLRAKGLIPPVDEAQAQARIQAHLHARGQAIAHDLDLGQVNGDDLAELGRLDAIAQHPALDQDLAVRLEMIAAERDRPVDWPPQCACTRAGHPRRHAINATCTDPGPAPELHPGNGQDPEPPERERGLGRGRTGTASRQQRESVEEIEKLDPITEYLRNVPDPAEDWAPFKERKRP